MNTRSLVTLPLHAWLGLVSLVSTALLVCLLASATTVQAQQPGVWSATGSLGTGRISHTATLLANGKVLVVGGSREVVGSRTYVTTGTADLYDPATGLWSATGSLNTPRSDHIAVRLNNGKVLVAGGAGEWTSTPYLRTVLTSAEIYDPDTGTWSASGNLNLPRRDHLATLLTDGRVLVTGGSDIGSLNFGGALNTAELYDPATGAWKPTGTMNSPRILHTATLLPGGGVLVVGGFNSGVSSPFLRSAELYDPATGSWTPTDELINPRVAHTATLLHNGKVLVAGGVGPLGPSFDHGGDGVDTAELYDLVTGRWSATASLNTPRVIHTATLLPNGKVLAAGGDSERNSVNSAELYDPVTASWSVTGSLNTARSYHTATLLANGKVLVYGGWPPPGNNSAELYDPGFEIPLLTLNSTSFCIGDPWSLMVIRSARAASVQLLGVSNGAAWEIARWGATDQNGSFSANGTIAGGTEGTHTLSVEISGIRSNALSFAVSKCP
jgi:N-acetylneuraminic acid mutarotase